MDKFGKCPLRPTPRGLVEFVGKGAHSNRDGHTLRSEKRELVFPIQTSRRNGRARQPVERDVVKDVMSRHALSLPGKDACDKFLQILFHGFRLILASVALDSTHTESSENSV